MATEKNDAFLLDAGFWFALLDDNDQHHEAAARVWLDLKVTISAPTPVVTEVAYLVKREGGAQKLADFLDILSETSIQLETPTSEDYKRAAEIVRQYDDANLDFVDVIIFAIAERLNITKILTVDARHFRMFRPRHCIAFEILP